MTRGTRGMMGMAITGLALATTPGLAQDALLPGRIYDFKAEHPDFGLASASGGEIAGLLDVLLGASGRPMYLGTGTQLTQQALDADSNPIAPHLFTPFDLTGGPLVLENEPNRSGNNVLDTYDPSAGYDPSTAVQISGTVPTVPGIANITPPPFAGTVIKQTNIFYKNESLGFDITGEFHCDNFSMRQSVMKVRGDTVIRVDNQLKIITSSRIEIDPGATLTFWVGGTADIQNQCYLNDGGDHEALVFNNFGSDTMTLSNHSFVTATVNSPNATFHAENNTDFYGAITAQDLVMDNSSGVHLAGEIPMPSACFAEGDTQEGAGNGNLGDITNNVTFNSWFSDAPGLNLQETHQIWLNEAGGIYTMSIPDWDPINGELYGNEGQPRNGNFTFAGESLFSFNECSGQYFEITTGMDAWVFINDDLVIDLGGTTSTRTQRIELDRLDLGPGLHRLRLFIAHRMNGAEDLSIKTTVQLTPPRGAEYRMTSFYD